MVTFERVWFSIMVGLNDDGVLAVALVPKDESATYIAHGSAQLDACQLYGAQDHAVLYLGLMAVYFYPSDVARLVSLTGLSVREGEP